MDLVLLLTLSFFFVLIMDWTDSGLCCMEQGHLPKLYMVLWNTNICCLRIMTSRMCHWLWLEDGGRQEKAIDGL